jgi:two-component system, sensor histidine kinase RegB
LFRLGPARSLRRVNFRRETTAGVEFDPVRRACIIGRTAVIPPMSANAAMPFASLLSRLTRVRWGVLVVALLISLMLPSWLGFELAVWPLLVVIAIALAWNFVFWRRLGAGDGDDPLAVFSQLLFDLVVIAALLFFSGGATNPLVFMLLPPVAIAALTLPPRLVVAVAAMAVAAYSLLMVWYVPLPVGDPERAATLHLSGMWFTFVVATVMIGWFIVRMTHALRQREAELAAVREQALRDERVLALGTLAAGAAHELGTPLATLAVLADELDHDGRLDIEARADLQLMREQIAYCKRIITGLTELAGAGRGEHAERMAADRWLRRVFADWSGLRGHPDAALEIVGADGAAPDIVAEPSLEHGLHNLLDNALRAGTPIRVMLDWDSGGVRIAVRDSGSGFARHDLARAGRENFPAHPRGSGVGLLLTRAAVERQGGRLRIANADGGGALAELEIPVATMPPHD